MISDRPQTKPSANERESATDSLSTQSHLVTGDDDDDHDDSDDDDDDGACYPTTVLLISFGRMSRFESDSCYNWRQRPATGKSQVLSESEMSQSTVDRLVDSVEYRAHDSLLRLTCLF